MWGFQFGVFLVESLEVQIDLKGLPVWLPKAMLSKCWSVVTDYLQAAS